MERGRVISSVLVTTIENSMRSIVVLSENYASSTWCLEELVKILECKRKKGQRVISIFYNIDPSDVRYQRGKIGEAMAKHERNLKENMERVQIWRDSLTEVSNLSGWVSRNQNEAMFIEEIIQSILNMDPVINMFLARIKPLLAALREHEDDGIISYPIRDTAVDKKLFRSRMDEEVRSISSDHVGEDSKGQGKLSTISGCKNLSIKFRTSIKARLLGLTWSTTIKARLRAEQVLIVLHYVNDSIVSSYTNASILILVVGSWNLLYVLFLQSCEDVFHGSPVTIFCELKLSDLRSCEVGCFGNPLNWGDRVVRGIIPAEVEGEEAGKGKP
ncbi:putative disease resistance protein At4g11170 [Vitis riparia]|uniref:putative disease resistance protein At4g11170 n=1 Tax=Vitis riparia TaxID=96939 RepID=UPI00155AD300|nr:putative disease resistance protein At4g11170 [Vitis riparia]